MKPAVRIQTPTGAKPSVLSHHRLKAEAGVHKSRLDGIHPADIFRIIAIVCQDSDLSFFAAVILHHGAVTVADMVRREADAPYVVYRQSDRYIFLHWVQV